MAEIVMSVILYLAAKCLIWIGLLPDTESAILLLLCLVFVVLSNLNLSGDSA